jgi:hypothetical protein
MNASITRIEFKGLIIAAACGGALGCGDEPVNIGDGPGEVNKNSLTSYAATWDGYVEAYTFHSGSDRVRVTIDETGAGFLQVGEGAALPLPTDPTIGWPPSTATVEAQPVNRVLHEGIRYSLGNVAVGSERIRFRVETNEGFAPFCEIQTPALDPTVIMPSPYYSCFVEPWTQDPAMPGMPARCYRTDGDQLLPIDCGRVFTCLSACDCDATSCTSRDGLDVPVDAALDDAGDELVGTIILPDEDNGARTIRLKRQ